VPEWTPELLLFVFASHAPFFAWRFRRTREPRHAATSVTFVLLAAVYALRVFAPEASWGGVALYRIARVPALCAAALSLGLLVRHHLAARS
jgi:hypothetical protein